ncbi:MAG: hypothetical protein H0U99_05415 [Chthoniobacterales bacterium]|nr:hypothetical protein [Chthoniobacterales bacterium]
MIIDLATYIDPAINSKRPYGGQSRELLSFGWRDLSVERAVVQKKSISYRGTKVRLHGRGMLAFYQNVSHLSGLTIGAVLFFSIVGGVKASGPIRLGIALFGLSACGLYLLPVLTLSYNFRYGIPAESFLVVSGVLAAVSIWPRATALQNSCTQPDNPRSIQPPGAA